MPQLEAAPLPPVKVDHREHIGHALLVFVILGEPSIEVRLGRVTLTVQRLTRVDNRANVVGILLIASALKPSFRDDLLLLPLNCIQSLGDHVLVVYLSFLVFLLVVDFDCFFELATRL